MTLQINHSPTEVKVEKALKKLKEAKIPMAKQEFLIQAVTNYVEDLVKRKVIKF